MKNIDPWLMGKVNIKILICAHDRPDSVNGPECMAATSVTWAILRKVIDSSSIEVPGGRTGETDDFFTKTHLYVSVFHNLIV